MFKFKQWIYGKIYGDYAKKVNSQLTNLKIIGKENLKGIKAAIITCNHISKADNFAIKSVIKENFMFVAAEHNNWKGPMGDISRNCGYLPLPKDLRLSVMRNFTKAINYYLSKGKKILIYPEKSMWREYKLPRPLQDGAFHYAAQNNVPVIPMFITIKEKSNRINKDGTIEFGDYTLHILNPIYPKKGLSIKDNQEYMKLENYRLWKDCYQTTYHKKLEYKTKKDIWNSKFSEYNLD